MTGTTPRTATFLLRQQRQTQGFEEPLAEGVALTLLWIPPGGFWMGPAPGEVGISDEEGPRQLVDVPGFFLAQTPITQAQWRAVAQWEPPDGELWERELDPSPSWFCPANASKESLPFSDGVFRFLPNEQTTDQRPVECVDWNDAKEFCHRLSQRTGRDYTLPSEARWEYACRAGSTTPFAFGKTLCAELANYNASYGYDNGAIGPYRQQTTPVRMFPANAWGLHDMHGNVEEWCLEDWPWPNDIGKMVVTRGGSWNDHPIACRSAARAQALAPGGGTDRIGLRVVCLPQGRSAPAEVVAPGASWEAKVEWSGGAGDASSS